MLGRSEWKSVLLFLLCFAGSGLVGLAVFGTAVFNPRLVYFQFITSGAVVAALVVAFASGGMRAALAVGLVSLVALLATLRPTTGALFLRDVLWAPMLVAAVLASLRLSAAVGWPRFGRFVYWGLVFGACHLAVFAVLTIANGRPFDADLALTVVRIGALIGAGAGLGKELHELFIARPLEAGQ